MTEKPEFFWSPPRPGERIVAMVNYRDFIVLATSDGVYAIRERGAIGLDNHQVEQIKFVRIDENP